MTVGLVDVRCVNRTDTEQEKYVLFGTYLPSLQRVILSFRNSKIQYLVYSLSYSLIQWQQYVVEENGIGWMFGLIGQNGIERSCVF